jgi:hypothetical protein
MLIGLPAHDGGGGILKGASALAGLPMTEQEPGASVEDVATDAGIAKEMVDDWNGSQPAHRVRDACGRSSSHRSTRGMRPGDAAEGFERRRETTDEQLSGSVPTLDIFALRDAVIDEYKRFATSFTTVSMRRTSAHRSRRSTRKTATGQSRSSRSTRATSARTSIRVSWTAGVSSTLPAPSIFQLEGAPLALYKHQEQAIALAAAGTKLRRHHRHGLRQVALLLHPHRASLARRSARAHQARTRAIIIYPMNALANSQLEELDKFVGNVPARLPSPSPATPDRRAPKSASASPTTHPTSCSPTS